MERIFERKFRGEKNDEKKVRKVLASAGNADPSKEGFRMANAGQVQHAFAPRGGGRIVYASRIPPRPKEA